MENTKLTVRQTRNGQSLFINDKRIEGVTSFDVSLNGSGDVTVIFTSVSCDLAIYPKSEMKAAVVGNHTLSQDGEVLTVELKD